MPGNDIFDKIESKSDEGANGKNEKKITFESIMREYDAKKAEAERLASEQESAEKRFADFKRELESYNEQPTSDDDDSDMKIVTPTIEESLPDEKQGEKHAEADISEKKLDIMAQISKRFEQKSEQVEEAPVDIEQKADEEPSQEMPEEAEQEEIRDYTLFNGEPEQISNTENDQEDTEGKEAASEGTINGFDYNRLKQVFNDDFEETHTKSKNKKGNDKSDKVREKVKKYDDNGEKIYRENAMFVPPVEHMENSDPEDGFAFLRTKLLKTCFSMVGVFLIMLLCFYTESAPYLNLPHPKMLEPGKAGIVFVLFDLQLLFFAAMLKLNSLCRGAAGLFCKKPCAESFAFGIFAVATIQSIASAVVAGKADNCITICSTACLSLFVLAVGDFLKTRNEFIAYRIITTAGDKFSFKDIIDEETPDKISDYVPENSTVLDVRKVGFVGGFFKRSYQPSYIDKSNNKLVWISLAVAAVASIVYYIFNNGIYESICGFVSVFLTSAQAAVLISSTVPEYIYQEKAAARKCAYIGHDLCDEYADVSVVSFKDTEVFNPKDIKVTNIRTYGDTRIDNVIVTMARVFANIGGPLSSVFSNSVAQLTTQNGEIEIIDVAPDGLWIKLDGSNTYIGTLSYMQENNFDVIADEGKEVLRQKDIGILYLASSDRVVAKFYIEYKLNTTFESVLRNLFNQKICARIKSLDPCVNSDFIRALLRRPECLFSVVKPSSPEEIEKSEPSLDARIVCSSNENSLIHAFLLLRKMKNAISANNFIKLISWLLGLSVSVLALIGGSLVLSPTLILVIQIFWIAATLVCSKLSER